MVTRGLVGVVLLLAAGGCAEVLGIEARDFEPCANTATCRERNGAGSYCDAGVCSARPVDNEACSLLEPEDGTDIASHDWQQGEPVVVGALIRRNNDGEAARLLATRLAMREINDNLGLGAQRRLVMVACDYGGDDGLHDGDSAAPAIEAGVDYLAEDLGASVIVAGSSSATTQIAINHIVRRELSVAYLSSFSTSTQLTDYPDDGLLWRTAATDAVQAVALAALIGGTAGLTRLAIVYVDDTYGRPLQQNVSLELQKMGSPIAVSLHSFSSGETQFSDVVASALDQSPDAMLVIGVDGASVVRVFDALVATGASDSIAHHFVADAAKDQSALLADDIDPRVAAIVADVLGTAPFHSTGPQYATFKQALDDAFGIDADGFSFLTQSYDAAYLAGYGLAYAEGRSASDGGTTVSGATVAEGFARCVSGPSVLVGRPDWNQARRALTEGDDADRRIDIDGTSGPLDFDLSTGDTFGPIEIWRANADRSSFETCAVCDDESCDVSACR